MTRTPHDGRRGNDSGYIGSLQSAMVGPSSTTGGRRYYYARVGWRDRYSALQRGKRILTSGTIREGEKQQRRYIVKWWLI